MIDIVIPTYNAFYYINRCINSILKYNTSLINKIIISDDMSDEGRLEDLFDDSRIMIVRDGRRKYFSENTNYGVSFVTTDYFITMNADCMITKFSPNWMQDFENHRDPRYGILAATPCMEDHGHPPAEDGIENKRVGPLAWYIKTALWKEMGGLRFDGKFIHWHSDVEFMDRIEKAGLGVGLLCIYIQHEGGKSIPHELWHTHDGG